MIIVFHVNKDKKGALLNLTSSRETYRRSIDFEDQELAMTLFGVQNSFLNLMESEMDVEVGSRGTQVDIIGKKEAVELIVEIFSNLEALIQAGISISESDVVNAIRMGQDGTLARFQDIYQVEVAKDYNKKPIRTKNMGQFNYVNGVKKNDVVFGIGPAGTGKTFLAVAMAVEALRKAEVKRIVLTRPAVEAGESLGFLPGDLKEKVDPYLRPLYDSLYAIFGVEHTNRLMEREIIEVAPLAYMRGRTLDDAFVILDEAQNTTIPQMKMFLTRLGFGSKMIVNGDTTQIDLPRGTSSGLINARDTLEKVEGIRMVRFSASDVVRHPLVSRIIRAYEEE